MRVLICLFIIIVTFSCKKKARQLDVQNENVSTAKVDSTKQKDKPKQELIYTAYEKSLIADGFLDVEKLGVKTNLPYTTVNNFTEQVLYDSLQHAFLRPLAYQKLSVAQTILQKEHHQYSLIVFDAFRPNAVQHKMWKIVGGTEKEKYVASPSRGSIHNFGLAVDCSIINLETGHLLDMGTAFDHLGIEAEYRHNALLVQQGKITDQAKQNRELLRKIMTTAGFQPINSEWWHFNALSKEETRAQYEMK